MNAKIFAAIATAVTAVTVQAGEEPTACHELPGTTTTCGSHCFPNCDTQNTGTHPDAFDYNHYLVIPEARSCYIDTITYGRFDAFLSINSQLNITMDIYTYRDGLCQLEEANKPMIPGAIEGDDYC
jgi:hypothetical protein